MPELITFACDKCGTTAAVRKYTLALDRDAVEVLLDPICAGVLTLFEARQLGREVLLPPPAKKARGTGGGLSDGELMGLHRPN